jgi:hypothetical protein
VALIRIVGAVCSQMGSVMSSQREQKRSEAVEASVKVALIGAAATIAAAVITAAVSWQHQHREVQEKSVQVAPRPDDERPPTPLKSKVDPERTAEATPKSVLSPAPTPSSERSSLNLDRILNILQLHRQRATFGAVAGVLDRDPERLFDGYPRTPRTAWVVNKESGRPTGHKPTELPPDLFSNSHVITTNNELLKWMEGKEGK